MHRQKLYSPEASPRGKEQVVGQPGQPHSQPSTPTSPTQLHLRTGSASPALSRSPPAETGTHPTAASSAPAQGLSPQTSPPGTGQGHWVRRSWVVEGPVHASQAHTTHLSEVMDSVQSPRLLPRVCLCPVAGAGTDHPSRKMGDWVRQGRCYQWGLALKEMGIT